MLVENNIYNKGTHEGGAYYFAKINDYSQKIKTFNINYTVGKIQIFLNGVKLVVGTDVTATTGTTVVFPASPALTTNDTVSLCTF